MTARTLTELAHLDIDVEIERARAHGDHIDAFVSALANLSTTHEIDSTCPRCGQRTIYATRDPRAPGAVAAVCNRCAETDSPTDYPNTGFPS